MSCKYCRVWDTNNMKIFEGTWFSKKKEEQKEIVVPENLPVEEKQEVIPRKSKTLQDIDQAQKDIWALEDKNNEALTALREQKRIAREMGVNEFEKDGHSRTDTFRELITPFEEKLAAISLEIGALRTENDLDPSTVTVLEKRLVHLEEIENGVQSAFDKTEQGGVIKEKKQEMADLEKRKKEIIEDDPHKKNTHYVQEEISKIQNQINLVQDKITKIYYNDKIAYEYAETVDRISHLKVDVESRLRNAKDPIYDKNGINQIR